MNIVQMLESEHREVEGLFERYESGETAVAADIVRSLTLHTQIEEQAVYPAVRQYVDGGDDMVDHAVDEHGQVKEMLARFQANPEDASLAEEIKLAVEAHVSEEETEVFPALRESCSDDRLTEIGRQAEQIKTGGNA